MTDIEKSITDGTLTEKEIIHLLLHNAQHMATREEVKADIKDLKVDLREDISKVETSLKQDISKLEDKISKVETSLKQDISKVSDKFDKAQWLIVATLLTVVFKDYIASLIK